MPNAADVLSNIGFAWVGLWGLWRLWLLRTSPELSASWPGYSLFLWALILTAAGSSYYHLAPDNARLVWDRLPIALACAGLLAAARAETRPDIGCRRWTALLSLGAVLSVFWWYVTDRSGTGDLRPYLLIQGLPLLLIPLWQTIHDAPRKDRLVFAGVIILYVAAKIVELYDHEIYRTFGWISGHTLKHLLATAAAAVLVVGLVGRVCPSAHQTHPRSRSLVVRS